MHQLYTVMPEIATQKIYQQRAGGNQSAGTGQGIYFFVDKARFRKLFRATRGIHSLCWSRGLKAYFGIGDVSDLAITEGAAQPKLRKFMDIVAEGFRKLSTAEKALLRNYAAMNDYDRASSLLSKLAIEFFKDAGVIS